MLASSEPLRTVLNQRGGLVLARIGSHPPWPARVRGCSLMVIFSLGFSGLRGSAV